MCSFLSYVSLKQIPSIHYKNGYSNQLLIEILAPWVFSSTALRSVRIQDTFVFLSCCYTNTAPQKDFEVRIVFINKILNLSQAVPPSPSPPAGWVGHCIWTGSGTVAREHGSGTDPGSGDGCFPEHRRRDFWVLACEGWWWKKHGHLCLAWVDQPAVMRSGVC